MNQRTDPSFLRSAPVDPRAVRPARRRQDAPRIGQILLELGEITPGDLIKAIALRAREDTQLGDILLANEMVSEAGLFRGLAQQFNCDIADLVGEPPDTRLIHALTPQRCLHLGLVPWKRVGAATLVVTSRPEQFNEIRAKLPAQFGRIMMLVASESAIQRALLSSFQGTLASRAENRVRPLDSCRGWNSAAMARLALAMLLVLVAGLVAAPRITFALLTGWAILALLFNTGLKAAAAWATWRGMRARRATFQSQRNRAPMMQLPKISIMVPLFREREIAGRLVRRLNRLTYPRELLDICLVVEADDAVTHAALDAANLPNWMRQIRVPMAALKTKPRALNYALDFCKGSIIGVYDAEDAPEPDQLFKVARRFHDCAPDVACLQGVLDFYNPRTNWLSRCFTIEYATWFRVVLPGLERMGFVIPLGGTTIFFRRKMLEEIGGWDAHNVTEDADLGVRLARRGYRTELLPTLTEEEANCHVWPWVRQRSRWLKGYAITWAVHMRDPPQLWRDLGAWRFFGVQVLFLGALSQFLLAPLLWSFWALPLGLPHPLQNVLSGTAFYLLAGLFLLSELVTQLVGIFALAPERHRRLWLWVPTLHLYYPLAAIAAYKGIWELISKPFYWDKTAHGHSAARSGEAMIPARSARLSRRFFRRRS
jgi:cellulose synthase/poly-beta-1,6-N-acetylglucosamine synthase-like glycosyltransferase